MGVLTGRAATLFDGKEAVLTQTYGPEARGGASNADVILSDKAIDFPLVTRPNILVAMFQEAYRRFRPDLKAGGVLVLDEALVKPEEKERSFHSIPATRLAEEMGLKIAANVVMLGFFVRITGAVTKRAMEEAIRKTVKPKVVELNLKAFDAGFRWAEKAPVGTK